MKLFSWLRRDKRVIRPRETRVPKGSAHRDLNLSFKLSEDCESLICSKHKKELKK